MGSNSPAPDDQPVSFTSDERVAMDLRGAIGPQIGDGNNQINNSYYYPPPPTAVSWPVVVGRAPRLAEAYLVRPAQRAAVRAALNRAAVSTQAPVAVVTGGSGTGKTQLAADCRSACETRMAILR